MLFISFIPEITGSAEEDTTAATITVDENRTEEERVSSASPLYSPPSSPAVYIQPGGEVQFTKEKSPGKENQGNWIRIVEIILSKTERQWDSETV